VTGNRDEVVETGAAKQTPGEQTQEHNPKKLHDEKQENPMSRHGGRNGSKSPPAPGFSSN
jgi:hypothetical protein